MCLNIKINKNIMQFILLMKLLKSFIKFSFKDHSIILILIDEINIILI